MRRILPFARIISAAAVAIILALLAWQCMDIYQTGNDASGIDDNGASLQSIYSLVDVSARLQAISAPLLVCGLVIVAVGVLHAACFHTADTPQKISAENRLRLIKARISTLPSEALREERCRQFVWLGAGVVILLCSLPCLLYLLNGAHFTSWQLETVMGDMVRHIAPWVLMAFLTAIMASLLCQRSFEREIRLLQGSDRSESAAQPSVTESSAGRIRVVLYLLAVAFIVLGVLNGGLRDVLVKAINICTECIGLG